MAVKKRNIFIMTIFTFGISSYWAVENFWINLYWTRNVNPQVSYISWMVAITATVGVLTQILFGAFSDSSTSRFGRRRAFILFGSITGGITICLFPLTRTFTVLLYAIIYAVILDAIITFFGDITTPTRLALLAESTDIESRGKANAVLNIASGAGLFVIVAVSGYVIDFAGPDFAFYFGGISLIITGIILFIFIDDPPVTKREKTWRENFKETFTLDSYRENKSLYILLLFLFINSIGVQTTAPFLFIYIESVLGLSGLTLAIVLGGMLIMAFFLAIPLNVLLDKYGRKRIAYIVTIGGLISAFIFTFIPPNQGSTALLALIIGGFSSGFAAALATGTDTWMQDLAPENRRGSMLAYKIVAVVIPMVPGAMIGGYVADYGPKPPGFLYSPLIFILSALIMICSIPVLKYVEETLKKKE